MAEPAESDLSMLLPDDVVPPADPASGASDSTELLSHRHQQAHRGPPLRLAPDSLGVLPRGRLLQVARADLVGRYVGHTAQLTEEVFQSALGGVLFMDEA